MPHRHRLGNANSRPRQRGRERPCLPMRLSSLWRQSPLRSSGDASRARLSGERVPNRHPGEVHPRLQVFGQHRGATPDSRGFDDRRVPVGDPPARGGRDPPSAMRCNSPRTSSCRQPSSGRRKSSSAVMIPGPLPARPRARTLQAESCRPSNVRRERERTQMAVHCNPDAATRARAAGHCVTAEAGISPPSRSVSTNIVKATPSQRPSRLGLPSAAEPMGMAPVSDAARR